MLAVWSGWILLREFALESKAVERCQVYQSPSRGSIGRAILELWNSRSSFRSVWPRSPCCRVGQLPCLMMMLIITSTYLSVNIDNDIVALSISHRCRLVCGACRSRCLAVLEEMASLITKHAIPRDAHQSRVTNVNSKDNIDQKRNYYSVHSCEDERSSVNLLVLFAVVGLSILSFS